MDSNGGAFARWADRLRGELDSIARLEAKAVPLPPHSKVVLLSIPFFVRIPPIS